MSKRDFAGLEARVKELEQAIATHRQEKLAYYYSIQALSRIEDINLWKACDDAGLWNRGIHGHHSV